MKIIIQSMKQKLDSKEDPATYYVDENNASLNEIDAGLIHAIFATYMMANIMRL